MTKIFCLFILFLVAFSISSYSQDTIFKRNGDKIISRVLEIDENIHFKRFDIPDGPTYVLSKADVLFIHFQNGRIENMDTTPIVTNQVVPEKVVQNGKITMVRNKFYYGGHRISQNAVRKIAFNVSNSGDIHRELSTVSSCRVLMTSSIIFGFIPIAVGTVCLPAGVLFRSDQVLTVGFSLIFTGCLFEIAGTIFKHLAHHHTVNLVNLYNETIQ